MLIYSIIMFIIAALFFYLAFSVRNGNTSLIKDYHQHNVKKEDKYAYGKAFAKGLFGIAITLFLSGVIPLFVRGKTGVLLLFVVIIVGMLVSFVMIIRVQKKYNGGIF